VIYLVVSKFNGFFCCHRLLILRSLRYFPSRIFITVLRDALTI
jgi:hypothetical protein